MCFDVENECINKKFQECHMRDYFDHNKKGIYFLGIFLGCYFSRIFNLISKIFQMQTYLLSFIDNSLN